MKVDWKNPQRGSKGEQFAMGDCPVCSKESKFHIDFTGKYGCFKCKAHGTIYDFLRWLHEESVKATVEYSPLSIDRNLLNGVGLASWEICRSVLTGDWLVPGWSIHGKLNQLYRYKRVVDNKGRERMATVPTPGLGHQLMGVNLFNQSNLICFLCEGWSDGVALWETMMQAKHSDTGLLSTSNKDLSLLRDANVLACPTASVFFESWLPLFSGKVVNLMFDNDHPRSHAQTGKPIDGAGITHARRIARMLHTASNPPEQVNVVKWGDFVCNPELPDGFDVRDELCA